MEQFQLKVLDQGLQLVRSKDDAYNLADFVIDHMVNYSEISELRAMRNEPEICDVIVALAILIEHEKKTAEKPSFVNIFMTLGTIKGKQELANNPDWVKFSHPAFKEWYAFVVSCVQRVLNEFKLLETARA